MCCEQALSKTRGSALLRVAFSRNPIKHCALAEFRSSGGYFFYLWSILVREFIAKDAYT